MRLSPGFRRFLFRALLVLWAPFVATVGGALSVSWALGRMAEESPVAGWVPLPGSGDAGANPYEAARLALSGRLPLGRAEGLGFAAWRDETGEALQRGCAYTIEGPVPPSRFWTLRATETDLALLPPSGRRAATLHAFQALRQPDGTLRVTASNKPAEGNWLVLGGSGPFALVLTLHDPASSGSFSTDELALPSIRRIGCDA